MNTSNDKHPVCRYCGRPAIQHDGSYYTEYWYLAEHEDDEGNSYEEWESNTITIHVQQNDNGTHTILVGGPHETLPETADELQCHTCGSLSGLNPNHLYYAGDDVTQTLAKLGWELSELEEFADKTLAKTPTTP